MKSFNLVVRRAPVSERSIIYRMLELYQHDLSDIWDQDLDANGEYGYALERFWSEPDCHPFVAIVDGNFAGFALVDRATKVADDGWWMDQFFVLKKYRRRGIGAKFASAVFDALPGVWEVGQMIRNAGAQQFWRSTIKQYTGGDLSEHVLAGGWWEGLVQRFDTYSRQNGARVFDEAALQLLPMTVVEFNEYAKNALRDYGLDVMQADAVDADLAAAFAQTAFRRLLPDGQNTAGHAFYTLRQPVTHAMLGYLWLAETETTLGRSAFVYDIAVSPEFRGRGYGTHAMRAAEAWAAQRNLPRIGLAVFGHNEGACRLYRRLGYRTKQLWMTKTISQSTDDQGKTCG